MTPRRGEVWIVTFDPVEGHEQAGRRPALVLSVDGFNASAADLAIVLPITSKPRNVRSRVEVRPPEGGLSQVSYVIGEQPRAVSISRRFGKSAIGSVSPTTLATVESIVRALLGL